jgi:hypothetical protein
MAIDRAAARRRVKTITALATAGAAALTGGFAFGASRGSQAATADASTASDSEGAFGVQPQVTIPRAPDQSQGFAPPSASTAPPQGMSGGS